MWPAVRGSAWNLDQADDTRQSSSDGSGSWRKFPSTANHKVAGSDPNDWVMDPGEMGERGGDNGTNCSNTIGSNDFIYS